MSKSKGGRPSLLTEDTKKKLFDAIRGGHRLNVACAYAGVTYSTIAEWRARGEGRDPDRKCTPEYAKFAEELKIAEEIGKMAMVEQWKKHFPRDWKAIATYLERRWPSEFGRHDAVDLHHSGGVACGDPDKEQLEHLYETNEKARELCKELYRSNTPLPSTGEG